MESLRMFFVGIVISVTSLFSSAPSVPAQVAVPEVTQPRIQEETPLNNATNTSEQKIEPSKATSPKVIPVEVKKQPKSTVKTSVKTETPKPREVAPTKVATSTQEKKQNISSEKVVEKLATTTELQAEVIQLSSPGAVSSQSGIPSSNPSQAAQDACDELDEGAVCSAGGVTGTCQARGEYFACFSQ